MDLIDKNMAIDICNSAIDLWHGQLGEGALVAVKEGIEGLPSVEPEPHWIPVTERLPEVGDYVLCSQINGDVGEGKMYGNEKWHICYDDSIYKKEWVEAWQPLPESYQEVKE